MGGNWLARLAPLRLDYSGDAEPGELLAGKTQLLAKDLRIVLAQARGRSAGVHGVNTVQEETGTGVFQVAGHRMVQLHKIASFGQMG